MPAYVLRQEIKDAGDQSILSDLILENFDDFMERYGYTGKYVKGAMPDLPYLIYSSCRRKNKYRSVRIEWLSGRLLFYFSRVPPFDESKKLNRFWSGLLAILLFPFIMIGLVFWKLFAKKTGNAKTSIDYWLLPPDGFFLHEAIDFFQKGFKLNNHFTSDNYAEVIREHKDFLERNLLPVIKGGKWLSKWHKSHRPR